MLKLRFYYLRSRCSEDFFYHVNMDISEKLSDTIKDEDREIISINNDKIDIYQIIENNLSMELPVKKICKEDCKVYANTVERI